jgi:hypothetical protein
MWYRAAALVVGIVFLASFPSGSTGAQDAAGNKFNWDAGYPKSGWEWVQGTPFAVAYVNYDVQPAATWGVTGLTFEVHYYDDAAGTMWNGNTLHSATAPWSAEKWVFLSMSGASFRVKQNRCTFSDGVNESPLNAGDQPGAGQNGVPFP